MPQAETTAGTRFGRYAPAGLLGLYALLALVRNLAAPAWHFDFFGLWSFAGYARGHPGAVAGIYNPALLAAFQRGLAPDIGVFYPFPFPPDFLVLIGWAGALPLGLAKAVWTAAGGAAMAGACWLLFAPGFRRLACVLPFLAVVSLQNAINGQTGFFTSALLIAGFALLPTRQFLAGVAFGVLAVKPQLGVVIPFALAGLGAWRAGAGAGVTALLLAAVSVWMFGAYSWLAWWHALTGYQAMEAGSRAELAHLSATVAGGLLSLQMPGWMAWGGQAGCSLAVAAITCAAAARAPYRLAAAVALAAVPVAAPHAFTYDTPELFAAMLLLAEDFWRRGAAVPRPVLALFLWIAMVLPAFIEIVPFYVVTPLSELALFAVIAVAAFRAAARPEPGQ